MKKTENCYHCGNDFTVSTAFVFDKKISVATVAKQFLKFLLKTNLLLIMILNNLLGKYQKKFKGNISTWIIKRSLQNCMNLIPKRQVSLA
jgi:hypothetical protein